MKNKALRVFLLPVALPLFVAAAFTAWLADNADSWNAKTQKASRKFLNWVDAKLPLGRK